MILYYLHIYQLDIMYNLLLKFVNKSLQDKLSMNHSIFHYMFLVHKVCNVSFHL
jgi:hypothetical protein